MGPTDKPGRDDLNANCEDPVEVIRLACRLVEGSASCDPDFQARMRDAADWADQLLLDFPELALGPADVAGYLIAHLADAMVVPGKRSRDPNHLAAMFALALGALLQHEEGLMRVAGYDADPALPAAARLEAMAKQHNQWADRVHEEAAGRAELLYALTFHVQPAEARAVAREVAKTLGISSHDATEIASEIFVTLSHPDADRPGARGPAAWRSFLVKRRNGTWALRKRGTRDALAARFPRIGERDLHDLEDSAAVKAAARDAGGRGDDVREAREAARERRTETAARRRRDAARSSGKTRAETEQDAEGRELSPLDRVSRVERARRIRDLLPVVLRRRRKDDRVTPAARTWLEQALATGADPDQGDWAALHSVSREDLCKRINRARAEINRILAS